MTPSTYPSTRILLAQDFLEKTAYEGESGKGLLLAAGSLGTAAIATLGASLLSKAYGRDFVSRMKGLRLPSSTGMVKDLKRAAGLPRMPHHELGELNNAFYLPPGGLAGEAGKIRREREKAKHRGDQKKYQALGKLLEADGSPHGGIFYGKGFKNPYVVAHEVGHALAANEPALKRYIEQSPAILNKLFTVGALAGGVAGVLKPEWIPGIGLGLAGLGALTTGTEYFSEREATGRGLDLMRRAGLKPSPAGEEAMEVAGKSYLWPGLTSKVLAPLAAAGVAKLIQSRG